MSLDFPHYLYDDCAVDSVKLFQEEVHAWAQKTFPDQTFASKLAHLRRELIELEEKPTDGSEYADCLILLLSLAEMNGVNVLEEAANKFVINKGRTWGPPDAEGVCRHLTEPEPPLKAGWDLSGVKKLVETLRPLMPEFPSIPDVGAGTKITCVLDTDGDGDCKLCAEHGGCSAMGGPFNTTLDLPSHPRNR